MILCWRHFKIQSFLKLITIISLVGCQNNSSESKREPRQAPKPVDEKALAAYRNASCAFSVKINGGANFEYANKVQKESTYFGKVLNIFPLAAILQADIDSGLQFIQQTKVTATKATSDKGGCKNFESLALAPNVLLQEWTKINDAMGSKDAFILGLFLPVSKLKKITGSVSSTPMIIYREDTDKWTLVHEYMHFLFNDERESQGIDVIRNIEAIEKIGQEYEQIVRTATEEKLKDKAFVKKASETFQKHELMIVEHLKSFYLEEMTIESNLLELYQTNSLTYTTDYSKLGAAWYVQSSFNNFLELIKSESEVHDKLKDAATNIQLTDVVNHFNEIETTIKNIYNEAQTLNDYAGSILKGESQLLAKIQSSDKLSRPLKQCAHSDGIRRIKIPKTFGVL